MSYSLSFKFSRSTAFYRISTQSEKLLNLASKTMKTILDAP